MNDFEEFKGDPNFMRSLARGLLVISAFSDRKIPMTIADLSRLTKLDKSVVRRCLYTLSRLGMVNADQNRFALDPTILQLGHAYFSSSSMVERSQPYLDQLGNTIYTNCALGILSDREVVYLARFQSKRLIQKTIGLGSRLPAYCTSIGRVLLAGLSAEQQDDYLQKYALRPFTQFTITDKEEIREILARVKEDGYAVVDQELDLGLSAIAIPVDMGAAHPPAALSVTVNSKYVSADELPAMYLDIMKELAKKLSTML